MIIANSNRVNYKNLKGYFINLLTILSMKMFLKKKKSTAVQTPEYNIHRTFQLGAFILLGLIIYGMYFADPTGIDSERQIKLIEQLDKERQMQAKTEADRIKEEMMKDPAFKKIQQFVDEVTSQINHSQGSVLKAYGGYIIFVPEKILDEKTEKNNSVEIKNDDITFKVSPEKVKITPIEVKKEPEKSGSGIENQKK